jgi:hypothetical protein
MKKSTYLALGMLIISSYQVSSQMKTDLVDVDAKEIIISNGIEIRYYYFPNLQAYFDTSTKLYIIKQSGVWITSKTIDINSRGYCLRNGFHVMLKGFLEDNPYTLINEHKLKYPGDYSSKQRRRIIASTN